MEGDDVSDSVAGSRVTGANADLDLLFARSRRCGSWLPIPTRRKDSARVYDFSLRWGTMLSGRL